jgi:hypothetical protein
VAQIAVCNLSREELENKIDVVARAVIEAVLSIPGTGLKEEDISFTFPRDFFRKAGIISVAITGEVFFNERMNYRVRQVLCRRVSGALQPVLRRKGKEISVEIKRRTDG